MTPTVMLDGLPEQLAAFMIRVCPNGLADRRYEIEDLQEKLSGIDPRAIEDAAYDLQALGLVRVEAPIGAWRVVLVQAAYAVLDPLVMGWSPTVDVIDLARLMLANDTGDAAELHAGTDWPKRHFNPAFQLLVPLFPDGRRRDFWHPEYDLVGVAIAEEDKAIVGPRYQAMPMYSHSRSVSKHVRTAALSSVRGSTDGFSIFVRTARKCFSSSGPTRNNV